MDQAYRLACGTALVDIVEQVKAWYEHEGRSAPRFSRDPALRLRERANGRARYLHYLCAVYRAEPTDLGCPAGVLRPQSPFAGPAHIKEGDPGGGTPAALMAGKARTWHPQ